MLREPISVAKMPSRTYSTPVRSATTASSAIKSNSLTTITLQLRNASTSPNSNNNNESMDSGVAGLATPHGGSPTSAASSTTSSSGSGALHHHHHLHHQLQQQHHASHKPGAGTPSPVKYPGLPLLKPQAQPDAANNEQRYIYDRSTRKTYYKDKFLGKGGFARVYELTDLTTGHIYAGKIIPKSRITKPHHKEKITREIELHRNLVHENVVRFYHCFEDEENVYIILENCSKRSLVHVMKHRKTLTEPEVRFYLRQLADGLRYVHAARIVHRDLKLGNMFLAEDMTVKIGDFGLAARLNADAKVTICGTPNYIAPEVLSRQGHGYEADIWAMGCIMFAMLVGQPPFETSSLNETYARISQNLYVIPQWVSRPARSLIRQLLAPDPRHRPTLDQVIGHEFFSSGLMPASLPGSCCSKAPVFTPNDSGIKSDCDSTNENASPVSNLRVPSVMSSASNRSRPESSVKLLQVDNKVGRSHSLKETPASRKEKKTTAIASTPTPGVPRPAALSPSALKQKMTQVLCLDGKDTTAATAKSPKPANKAPSLFAALDSCLYHAPQAVANPCPMPCQPLFISKWIDYSNRYGFGFQLSDRSVGVLFNDSTRISYSGDRSRLDFQDASGKTSSYSTSALPGYLTERLTLLRYFAQYMDENLTEGGDSHGAPASPASRRSSASPSAGHQPPAGFVHMKRWVRTPKAIIMQLDNNTLQINFFKDHTKIVLSSSVDASNGGAQFWVTYINSERLSSTYRLSDITGAGCEATLRERLVYALTVLREFEELDADASSNNNNNNNKM